MRTAINAQLSGDAFDLPIESDIRTTCADKISTLVASLTESLQVDIRMVESLAGCLNSEQVSPITKAATIEQLAEQTIAAETPDHTRLQLLWVIAQVTSREELDPYFDAEATTPLLPALQTSVIEYCNKSLRKNPGTGILCAEIIVRLANDYPAIALELMRIGLEHASKPENFLPFYLSNALTQADQTLIANNRLPEAAFAKLYCEFKDAYTRKTSPTKP